MSLMNDCKIFGDGEKLIILWQEYDKQYAHIIKSPKITGVNVSAKNNILESYITNERGIIPFSQPQQTFDISIELKALDISIEYGEHLNIEKSMFDKYTINELFKIINSKIKKR